MKRILAAVLLALSIAHHSNAEGKTYHVYYLGGQSNMDGFGTVADLPDELNAPVEGVYIFHGNPSLLSSPAAEPDPAAGRGLWAEVRPGHGWGFSSVGVTNTYGPRFGVELTFARTMRELHPDRNIAIIKYSVGGTSISALTNSASGGPGCWATTATNPPLEGKETNQFDHFLATLRHAFAARDVDGDGVEDTLIPAGIVWMQGESDSGTPDIAGAYERNLADLMELLRAAMHADDLAVAIGRISDSGTQPAAGEDGVIWTYGETIRAAQAAYCDADPHATLVTSTDAYGYSDPYHYDTAGYIDLGAKFAEALHALGR